MRGPLLTMMFPVAKSASVTPATVRIYTYVEDKRCSEQWGVEERRERVSVVPGGDGGGSRPAR